MIDAANLGVITDKVSNFSETDFKEIVGFNYCACTDSLAHTPYLEIAFVLVPKDESASFKTTIRFDNVSSLKINEVQSGYFLDGFEIIDNKEKGYSPENRFYVNDYEFDQFQFYCSASKVVSIEQIS